MDADENIHYFSGMDGSLFVPSEKKFFSNDQYCVDYFYYLDEIANIEAIKVNC